MANLKDLSGNELSELLNLYGRIERAIEHDFLHVAEHLPERLKRDIKNAHAKALEENERRYLDND
jgi:hypothetical protein